MKIIIFFSILVNIGVYLYTDEKFMNVAYESYYRALNGSEIFLNDEKYCLDKDFYIFSISQDGRYILSKDYINSSYLGVGVIEIGNENNYKKNKIYDFKLKDMKTIYFTHYYYESAGLSGTPRGILLTGESKNILKDFISNNYLTVCD
jgi:hypothetical protein